MSYQSESHASSKTPNGCYVPRQERLDLARMFKRDILEAPTHHCAHLNYLECNGETVFADGICVNLFLNALRLHWKVSGRVLRTLSDQGNDLLEFLTLEVDNKRIIGDLFTEETMYYLLKRDGSDALIILTTVVHDIYAATWFHWVEEHKKKNPHLGHYALIISHAQATSNQLSNNVLAFKDKAAPELRRWAEETASRHLIAIVTPGHLPSRPVARNNSNFSFGNDNSTPDLMGAKYIANPPPRYNYENNTNNNNYNPADSGPSVRRYQASIPDRPSFSTKRKAPFNLPHSRSTPPPKRSRGKTESLEKRRVYETYRPSGPKRPTFHNGYGRSAPRNPRAYPVTPEKHTSRYQQALDTPDQEGFRKERVRELDQKIVQDPSAGKSTDESIHTDSGGSSERRAPVVNGPSYAVYLRSQERDIEPTMAPVDARITHHTGNESDDEVGMFAAADNARITSRARDNTIADSGDVEDDIFMAAVNSGSSDGSRNKGILDTGPVKTKKPTTAFNSRISDHAREKSIFEPEEGSSGPPTTAVNARIAAHTRNKGFVGSEEGEIL